MNKAVFSPAKINLFLFIGRKHVDGYHSIQSLMYPLDTVRDVLTFTIGNAEISESCVQSHSDTLSNFPAGNLRSRSASLSRFTRTMPARPAQRSCMSLNTAFSNVSMTLGPKLSKHYSSRDIPKPQDNLVWKAAESFFKKTKIRAHVKIHIQKNIPLGAGLGGGSSNAATTLLTLNSLFKSPLAQKDLIQLAAQLGSDVPFFILKKSALIWGKGQFCKPVSVNLQQPILLLNPGFTIDTRWAYARWDRLGFSLTKKSGNVKNIWKNDFEDVIFPKYPILKKAKDKLVESGATYASMTGSGPSIYGVFENLREAKRAARQFDSTWMKWIG